jgi:Uma2 family endonuclease
MALLQKTEELLLTGEELFRRSDLGPCELVNGRIVPMTPTGHVHGGIEARLAGRLLAWAEAGAGGEVMVGEVGVYVRRHPDTVRAADVLWISEERIRRLQGSGYLDVAPELAVEILSPDDRWSDVTAKIADYFGAGVSRVWIVDPKLRRVFAYHSQHESRTCEEGQLLADPELLPGFSLPVTDLFR